MRDYDLYLFDFDNTLYDTGNGIRAILREALPVLGIEYEERMFSEVVGYSMEQIFDHFCSDRSLYPAYEEAFMAVVATDVYLDAEPFPETRYVLGELVSRGKRIGVVSGKMRYKIERLMGRDGLGDIPGIIVGYGETERHKPYPDPLELALSHFGTLRDRVLYIGDSPNDSEAAANCGVDCAIVNRRNGLTPDGIPCTYGIGSLSEIL